MHEFDFSRGSLGAHFGDKLLAVRRPGFPESFQTLPLCRSLARQEHTLKWIVHVCTWEPD